MTSVVDWAFKIKLYIYLYTVTGHIIFAVNKIFLKTPIIFVVCALGGGGGGGGGGGDEKINSSQG